MSDFIDQAKFEALNNMTAAELVERITKAVPADKLSTAKVDLIIDVGQFPSGEEGAEDWIMSEWVDQIYYNSDRNLLHIEVSYG